MLILGDEGGAEGEEGGGGKVASHELGLHRACRQQRRVRNAFNE